MPDDHRNDGATQTRGSPSAKAAGTKGMSKTDCIDSCVAVLEQAALSPDPDAVQSALGKLLSAGHSPEEIVDTYIPATARVLGDAWCRDELGFANVTIGSSRLQLMLRELSQFWEGDGSTRADGPTVLLAVASDNHHTLGAMVLSTQLRRKGVSVRLILSAKPHEVAVAARRGGYDAIFLSASYGEKLENLRKIVNSIKQEQERAAPIVIGGTILADATDVRQRTGANFTTNDPDEALILCGLTKKKSLSLATERSR